MTKSAELSSATYGVTVFYLTPKGNPGSKGIRVTATDPIAAKVKAEEFCKNHVVRGCKIDSEKTIARQLEAEATNG